MTPEQQRQVARLAIASEQVVKAQRALGRAIEALTTTSLDSRPALAASAALGRLRQQVDERHTELLRGSVRRPAPKERE